MISTLYEPFRHWSENGSVYILSDTHFKDSDCKLMDPDWIEPDEQVDILNSVIMKNDTFVCLGDVGSPEYIKSSGSERRYCFLETMTEGEITRTFSMRYIPVHYL